MHADPSDPLAELLSRAADEPAASRVASDLTGRVRRKVLLRARRRSAGVAVVCSAGVLGATALLLTHFRTPGQIAGPRKPSAPVHLATEPSGADQANMELASLNTEAAVYLREVDDLRRIQAANEQARKTAALLVHPGALARIEAARQRAAMILVRQAEVESAGNAENAQADESYRRAARLFPDTPAGRLAAGHLKTPHLPT